MSQASDREYLIRVSYMEIYNEEINDLLTPDSRKLQVHENLEVLFPVNRVNVKVYPAKLGFSLIHLITSAEGRFRSRLERGNR